MVEKIKYTSALLILMLLSQMAISQVKGKAIYDLRGLANHSGILVTFWDEFTFEVKDTAFTKTDGTFELDLKPGNYFVFYESPGFKQYRNPEAFEHKTLTDLGKVKIKPLDLEINGRKKWNPYDDKCVCNRPQHHTGTAIPSFGLE